MKLTRTRIRRFLIVASLVLLVVGVGLMVLDGWRQRKLLEIAHRCHGEIGWTRSLEGWPGWAQSLEPIPGIQVPRQVVLSEGTNRNDVRRFFEILAGSPHLSRRIEELYLWDSSTTTADLQLLPELPTLTTLELDRTPVDDECITVLTRCPALQTLSLRETAVGDAALAGMPSLPKLESLDLYGTQITEAGLKLLTRLPSLRQVDLRQTSPVINKWTYGSDQYAPVELTWLEARIPNVITDFSFSADAAKQYEIRSRVKSARAGSPPDINEKIQDLFDANDSL